MHLECARATTLFQLPARAIRRLLPIAGLLILGTIASHSPAAEPEPLLLTIEGHLVGRIEFPAEADEPALMIRAYYDLIPEAQREKLELHREILAELLSAYAVAFTAADSAELAQVVSDIESQWAAVLAIHVREFTREVQQILAAAYTEVYSFQFSDRQ